MAACMFGASGLRVSNLDLIHVRPKSSTLLPFHGIKAQKVIQLDSMVLSTMTTAKKAVMECESLISESDLSAKLESESKVSEASEATNMLIPNSPEIESLLSVLCDTTTISELQIKLGEFRLHVKRNLIEQGLQIQALSPATVVPEPVVEATVTNGSASSPSLALTKSSLSSGGVQSLVDKATDEGLVILRSPRVGYFRRSRTIKGKRAPPPCEEKDIVKEGQALCFIEQLGGEIPVETETPGEVVKILKEDGDPVGYGDALIAVLPSFPLIPGKVH